MADVYDTGGGSTFRSAPGLRPEPKRKTVDEKLKDASKMYEKLFLTQMMKAMKATVPEGGFIKQNAAEKMFREEMDMETVNNWSNQQGGVGLADMIYNNLIEKYGVQMGLRKADHPVRGPIAMNGKSDYTGPVRSPSVRPNELSMRFDRQHESGEPTELLAPWNGTVAEKKDLGDGIHMLTLNHDDGLTGRMVFRGQPERLIVGHSVQAGQRVGLLSPEAKSFFWNINHQASPLDSAKTANSATEAEKKPNVSE